MTIDAEVTPGARYRRRRNWGARILEYSLDGMRVVFLENERLRIGFLAGKGTDVFELNYKPRDVDFVWLSAGGIRNPRAFAPNSFDPLGTFIDSYPGGWQEILPNGGAPCSYLGAEFGQHAEVSLLPWDYAILEDAEATVAVRFSVASQKTPLRVTKDVRVSASEPRISFAETLINESDVPVKLMWGHHITFGPPFLRPGCAIHLPEGLEAIAHPEPINPAGRRVRSGRHAWPRAEAEEGGTLDLSVAPPPGTPSELLYLTGFDEGRYAVTDPERGVGLRIEWDVTTMPYLWFWQEYGATTGYPWYGRHYNIGLEPFTSYPTSGLAEAVGQGTALELDGGEQRHFSLAATVLDGEVAP